MDAHCGQIIYIHFGDVWLKTKAYSMAWVVKQKGPRLSTHFSVSGKGLCTEEIDVLGIQM